jgi:hypothetical protein
MKNAVFWDVTPCDTCKYQRFGGIYKLRHQGEKNQRTRRTLAVTGNWSTLPTASRSRRQLLHRYYNLAEIWKHGSLETELSSWQLCWAWTLPFTKQEGGKRPMGHLAVCETDCLFGSLVWGMPLCWGESPSGSTDTMVNSLNASNGVVILRYIPKDNILNSRLL